MQCFLVVAGFIYKHLNFLSRMSEIEETIERRAKNLQTFDVRNFCDVDGSNNILALFVKGYDDKEKCKEIYFKDNLFF